MLSGDKSKLLLLKGRSSVMMLSEIMVNDQKVGVSKKSVNLGHTVSTTDRDCITVGANNNLLKCFIYVYCKFWTAIMLY